MWKVTLEKILVGVRELGGSMTHNVNWTFIKGRYFPGDEHRDDFIKALEEGEARGLFRARRPSGRHPGPPPAKPIRPNGRPELLDP
jgi:hypothetical protein